MGYLYLIIATLLWSFVGVMVKSASTMFSSSVITLGRFLFGFVFLGLFMKAKGKKISIYWKDKWIWIGVIGKSLNYIFENIAISIGYAYSNVIIWPIQSVFLLIMAFILFKEKITPVKVVASLFCLAGVFLVSWKGMTLAELFEGNLLSSVLLIFAAIGAGIHVTSQKALVNYIDSGNMNFSIFLLSSMVTFIPVPFTSPFTGNVNIPAILSLIGLGLVTGVSFYLNAEALKKVSFLAAGIISNTSVLFTLLWSKLFLNESMNSYVISGVVILLIGMVLISIQKSNPSHKSVKSS
ncbi:MAG: DMT family transporter [Clostridiaceae bacterium]|nr:DMT family transporter [Clostridiaceae bacterium]